MPDRAREAGPAVAPVSSITQVNLRALPSVVCTAGIAVALSGCTVPSGGVLGFERLADGTVSAVVQMCKGGVDGVTIYVSDSDVLGEWEFDEHVTDEGSVPLGAGVEASIDPAKEYSSYAWSDDNSWSAHGPGLTQADILALPVGSVWAPAFDEDYSSRAYTRAEFDSIVDGYCADLV